MIAGDITVRNSQHTHNGSPVAAILTINPGVEIRFEPGTGLIIGKDYPHNGYYEYYGALSVQGTSESPVVFTSNAASPARGDWKGIYFSTETVDSKTLLEHSIVEYGGHTHNANLYFASASPTIKNNIVRYSSSNGIYLNASSPKIENSNIADNTNYGISANSSSAAWITDNTFSGNGKAPINIHPNAVRRVSGNSGTANSPNYIRVYGGELTVNSTWVDQPLAYMIAGDITVRNSQHTHNGSPVAAILTINPGVEIRFEPGTGLIIGKDYPYNGYYEYYGALSVQGTSESPVVFTSNAASPARGDWKGIYFRTETVDSKTSLEHSIVEYGGHTHNANLYFASASPTIRNNIVRYSNFNGIYADSSSAPSISKNYFYGNPGPAINVSPNRVKKTDENTCPINEQAYIGVRGGDLTSNSTWVKQGLPYVMLGDVTVRNSQHTHYGSPVAVRLTINPGVEVRFEPGTGLIIGKDYPYNGYYDYYGALSVQGTAESPVTFTSNTATPAPGDWKGIYFRNETYDAKTLLEHSIIEYGGHTYNANIYLANAKPTIQYNTIRNSSHSGIYVNGTGANGASIRCNNLKDNHYGVTVVNNARPVIRNNNFLRNQNYGINNTGTAAVDATDNWWNDVNGPGFNGDDVNGNVTTSLLADGRKRLHRHTAHQHRTLCAQKPGAGQWCRAGAGDGRRPADCGRIELGRRRPQPVGCGGV